VAQFFFVGTPLQAVLQCPLYEIPKFPVLWVAPRKSKYFKDFFEENKSRISVMELGGQQ